MEHLKTQINKDIKFCLGWLIAAFVVFNFLPKVTILPFLIILAVKYIQTRNNDVPYFSVFFLMIAGLAGLFQHKIAEVFSIGPIPISLSMFFMVVCYIKFALINKSYKTPFLFNKPVLVYLLYFAVLLLLGFAIGVESAGDTGMRHYLYITRLLVFVPIFLILPRIITANKFIERFAAIIFISVFINVIGQVFMLTNGVSVSEYLNPNLLSAVTEVGRGAYLTVLVRPTLGPWIVLLALFFAFYFLARFNSTFNKNYLYIIIAFSFISIFITATRGWILSFSFFIIVSAVIFSLRVSRRILNVLIVGLIVSIILYFTSNMFKIQIDKSFERFATVELILEGDISAGGTSVRHIRGAEVMEGFYENPIIGLGLSSKALDLTDQHVGNQAILMSGGIIGFIIIAYLLIYIGRKALVIGRHSRSNQKSVYSKEFKLIPVFLLSLYIIHSTSTTLFAYANYAIALTNMFMVVLSFSLINKMLYDHIKK